MLKSAHDLTLNTLPPIVFLAALVYIRIYRTWENIEGGTFCHNKPKFSPQILVIL